MFKSDYINAAKFYLYVALLFTCYLHAADNSGMDGSTGTSYHFHPKNNPYLVYAVLGEGSMHFKMHKEGSDLFVLQSRSCDKEYHASLFAKLQQEFKEDKELSRQNALTASMRGHFISGPIHALTYIGDQGNVFFKNVGFSGSSSSGPSAPRNDFICHVCLTEEESSSYAFDFRGFIDQLKKKNSGLKLSDLAPIATKEVGQRLIKHEASYIIIDLIRLINDASAFTEELSLSTCADQ